MSKTLIKHKYYSFELYEGRSILKLDWTEDSAGMTDEDFKDCLLKYAKLAEEHRIKKLWVVSERYRYKITPELMAWRKNTIIPMFQASGITQQAFQVGIGGNMLPSTVTEAGLRTECFETESSAMAWLNII